jgi:oligopeptide/dipeptide ABC transporter ATP-binding protein
MATSPALRTVWTAADPILEIRGLTAWLPVRAGNFQRVVGQVRALNGVDLTIRQGETLAVVGPPGCGKSTLGRAILRLVEPAGGEVLFKGVDLLRLPQAELRPLRRELGIVFQDPLRALDPRRTAGEAVAEPLSIHGLQATRAERQARVEELFHLVGLSPRLAAGYPHELSGALRQRVCIARALAADPSLVVCDEPLSALEGQAQAQTLELLAELRERLKLTYLLTFHDLSVARQAGGRIAVMHEGKVVEVGSASEVYRTPRHPLTAALIAGEGVGRPRAGRAGWRSPEAGEACPYWTRCASAQERCAREEPPLEVLQVGGHQAACFYSLAAQPPDQEH